MTPVPASGADDSHGDHAYPVESAAASDASPRRRRGRLGRATPRRTASSGGSRGRVWRVITGCLFGAIDAAFVAAAAYLCWTLVWSGGPLDRMGWPFPAFFAGPPLIVIGAVYFAICQGRGRRVARPLLAIVVVAGLSVQTIETGVLQKVRWVQARPQVLAIADHPPSRGTRQHRRFGTYWATVHANYDGTVLLEFDGSWNGLLYVPAEMPAYYRSGSGIGPEVMPRWWFYDTD